jgi:hypothetical protein
VLRAGIPLGEGGGGKVEWCYRREVRIGLHHVMVLDLIVSASVLCS